MRTKFADIGVFAIITAMGCVVIVQNAKLPEAFAGDVGPAFFPSSLAGIMIAMCVLGIVRCFTLESREVLDFPGFGKIVVTVAAIASYFALWQNFGQFYLLTFVYISGLVLFYSRDEKVTPKLIGLVLVGSAAFVALIYIFFTQVLYIKF